VFLGEFEQMVMLAVLGLEHRAYGVTIRREIEHHLDRDLSPGALYTTLDRLEAKGLLASKMRKPDADTNRSKRCFGVTPAGLKALRESRKVLERMWHGARAALGEVP
jgi:PadR family transcriptional regulator